ncbi:hypothetical protein [Nafulsella turpanensis]|uniref:hypothetical protein n=1 Tax=Nafulsella turpanensis TaxID=1265690 RepID=UPI00034A1079|nr:hypothetical protein [Nafulsella turpanensis]
MENINLHENGEQESYIPLAKEIIRNSFLYTLIARDETKALYAQSYKNFASYVIAHEVFYVKKEYRKLNPRTTEKVLMEVFPGNSDFGRWAWSITRDRDKALERFNGMTKPKEDGK